VLKIARFFPSFGITLPKRAPVAQKAAASLYKKTPREYKNSRGGKFA
jgi:hypothetical protein